MKSIPTTMKGLVLKAYNDDLEAAISSLELAQRPIPELKPSQVLVKMEAAPCNPSDLLFLQKKYGVVKTLPSVPGWEGAGTVVAAGGLRSRWLVGRRVAVGGQNDQDGTWAEYFVADAFQACIPLRDNLSMEQGATLIVNPLTAVALLDVAKKNKAAAVLQTAAAGQAGRMILRLAQEMKMPLVNIVYRQEQVDLLRDLGANYILNSADPDFDQQLSSLCHQLQVTVAFDAVAGEMTGQLFNAMPPGATVYVYGALSPDKCGAISPQGFIFQQKRVQGFFLTDWVIERGTLIVLRETNRLQKMMAAGELQTTISQQVPLESAKEALLTYIGQMTSGKVLLKPGL